MSTVDVKTMGRMLRQVEDPATRRMFEIIMQNIDALDSHVTTLEQPDTPAWINASLLNSWVQFGTPHANPGFFKDSYGDVHLRGVIKSGTAAAGTPLFSLPTEYRPEEALSFATTSNSAFARIDIYPDGEVQIMAGSNVSLSLDGIMFHAYR